MTSRALKLLVNLYPAAWRQRYGDEYLALLEAAVENGVLTWRSRLDIVRGAVDAHLHPACTVPGGAPMNQQFVFRIAAVGAILSTVLIALGLLNSARLPEDEAEFLLLISPVALLPLAIALHVLFRAAAPRASRLTAVIGLFGMGTFLLAVIAGALGELLDVSLVLPRAWLPFVFQGLIALIGVWLLLAAALGWRTRTLPVAIPGLMLIGGLSWLVMFLGIMLTSAGNEYLVRRLTAVLGLGLFTWMISHAVWTIWLGVWLWLPRDKNQLVTG